MAALNYREVSGLQKPWLVWIPKISGVYRWRNRINGKIYIGSAEDMRKRNIDLGQCGNQHLRSSIEKYGVANFELSVQEVVLWCNLTKKEFAPRLLEREQFWIDYYRCWDRDFGYNVSPTAGSPLGSKMPEGFSKEQSQRIKKVCSDPAYRKQMSERAKEVWEKRRSDIAQEEMNIFKQKVSKGRKRYWKELKETSTQGQKEAAREKRSAARKLAWENWKANATPEEIEAYRQRIREGIKNRPAKKIEKDQQCRREAMEKLWADSVWRANMLARRKKAQEKDK